MLAVSLPSEDPSNIVLKIQHIYICTFAVIQYLHLVAGLAPNHVRVQHRKKNLVLEALLNSERRQLDCNEATECMIAIKNDSDRPRYHRKI